MGLRRILYLATILMCFAPVAGSQMYDMASAANQYGTHSRTSSDAYNQNAYVIGPNNLLHIKILNEGGLQQTFRVDGLGFITHPLVGRVKLSGLTVSQAEQRMHEVLKGDYILNPHVTVFVLEHSRFSVLGEVRNPGNYEILGRLTLVEAISLAGGFTPVANEGKVKIVRKDETGETTIMVDVEDVMKGKSRDDSVYVQAGDVIHVPKSFF